MAYKSNGAIYIFRAKSFLRNKSFPSNGSLPYLMNNLDSTDIDTMQDLRNLNKVIK